MRISPQFGHRNFVASVPGEIGLPQLVHVSMVKDAVLAIQHSSKRISVIAKLPYIFYVSTRKFIIAVLINYILRGCFGGKPPRFGSKNDC
jgi:hypothetical protein